MASAVVNETRFHPTQFMVDLYPMNVTVDQKDFMVRTAGLIDFMKRESNYDIAFIDAWKLVDESRATPLTSPAQLLALLDRIQRSSISHLPKLQRVTSGGLLWVNGRANGHNFFGLSGNVGSNEKGIEALIRKVWVDREDAALMGYYADGTRLGLYRNKLLHYLTTQGEDAKLICFNEPDTREKTLDKITTLFLNLYRLGLQAGGYDRLIFHRFAEAPEREREALQILGHYFDAMGELKEAPDKIQAIVAMIQQLEQLHLYWDGNARSLYMLTNLLLVQNGLKPFYPTSLCVFDGNAVERLVEEVVQGQKRFADHFGAFEQLTKRLKEYQSSVFKIKELLKTPLLARLKFLETTFQERNFNLLLRQSASEAVAYPLLKLLVGSEEVLPIDLTARGQTSGNALDIALRYSNREAEKLLSAHGLQASQQSA